MENTKRKIDVISKREPDWFDLVRPEDESPKRLKAKFWKGQLGYVGLYIHTDRVP